MGRRRHYHIRRKVKNFFTKKHPRVTVAPFDPPGTVYKDQSMKGFLRQGEDFVEEGVAVMGAVLNPNPVTIGIAYDSVQQYHEKYGVLPGSSDTSSSNLPYIYDGKNDRAKRPKTDPAMPPGGGGGGGAGGDGGGHTGPVDPKPSDKHLIPLMGDTVVKNYRLGSNMYRNFYKDLMARLNRHVKLENKSNFTVNSVVGMRTNFGVVANHSAFYCVGASTFSNMLEGCSYLLNRANSAQNSDSTPAQTVLNPVPAASGIWKNYVPAFYDGITVTQAADLATLLTQANAGTIWNALGTEQYQKAIDNIKLGSANFSGVNASNAKGWIPAYSCLGQMMHTDGLGGDYAGYTQQGGGLGLKPLMVQDQKICFDWYNRDQYPVYVDVVVFRAKTNYVPQEGSPGNDGDSASTPILNGHNNEVYDCSPVGNILADNLARYRNWKAYVDSTATTGLSGLNPTTTDFSRFHADKDYLTTANRTFDDTDSYLRSPNMKYLAKFSSSSKGRNESAGVTVTEQHETSMNYTEIERVRIRIEPNSNCETVFYCGGYQVDLREQYKRANVSTLQQSTTNKIRVLDIPGTTLVFMCSVCGENIPVQQNGTTTAQLTQQAAKSSVYCEYKSSITVVPFSPVEQKFKMWNNSIDIQPTGGFNPDIQVPFDQTTRTVS